MAALSPVALATLLSVYLPAVASASPNPTGPNPLAKHPRQSITAKRMAPDYAKVRPGTKIRPAWVASRSFADSKDGFGLAEIGGKSGGGTYPARTTNGGAAWRTDGPFFFNATAEALKASNTPGSWVTGPSTPTAQAWST
jgi:hypothetical protein